MKRYLQTILVFDFALPVVVLGLPCFALLWALLRFQAFVVEKAEAHASYEIQSREVTKLSAELEPMRTKITLLKAILSNDDIEAKLGSGIEAGMEKLPSDEVEQTLHDFQYGASAIGPNYGEGRRLTLKLFSRWESLNSVTADWEAHFPNLVLESLSIDVVPGTAVSAPYLQSALSYFVIADN